MKTLIQRMREHVESRGGCAKDKDGKPVIPNGAWSMMLEAADLLESQQGTIDDLQQQLDQANCGVGVPGDIA